MTGIQRHLFLDWDGVVNAGFYEYRDEPRDTSQMGRLGLWSIDLPSIDVHDHQVLVDPEVVRRLNAIHALPGVTIFWLTATGRLARDYFGPTVGLSDFVNTDSASDEPGQVGYPYDGAYSVEWWKAVAVRQHLRKHENVEIMWVDDSLSGDLKHHMSLNDALREPRLSWVQPNRRLGLNSADLDAIEMWASTGVRVALDRDRQTRDEYERQWALDVEVDAIGDEEDK